MTVDKKSANRITRRSLLAAGAGAAALPVLSACGDDSGSGGGGTNAKTTLAVASWHWKETGGMEKWWALCKQTFQEKFPNVTVEERYVPYGQYFDRAFVELGAGNPADIYSISPHVSPVMMRNKLAASLADYLGPTSIAKDYAPVIDSIVCSYEDTPYVVPMNQVGGSYLYYDRAALEGAGLAVPTTPQQFFDAASALTKGGKFGAALASGTDVSAYFWYLLSTMAFGGLWWDLDTPKTPTVNTPEVVAGFEWYKSLQTNNLMPKGAETITLAQLFFEEKAAMMWNGVYSMPQIQANNPELAARTGVAPLPWPDGRTWLGALGCIIAERSRNKDVAWEYLKHMSSPEMQLKFVELTGTPTGYNIELTPELKQKMPHLEVFRAPLQVDPLLWRIPTGFEAKVNDFFKTVQTGAEKFLYGGDAIKPTLDGVQRDLEEMAKSL